jgi:hypothetical protein
MGELVMRSGCRLKDRVSISGNHGGFYFRHSVQTGSAAHLASNPTTHFCWAPTLRIHSDTLPHDVSLTGGRGQLYRYLEPYCHTSWSISLHCTMWNHYSWNFVTFYIIRLNICGQIREHNPSRKKKKKNIFDSFWTISKDILCDKLKEYTAL